MYNSGNINLYWDGGAAMDRELLQSFKTISDISQLPDNWNDNGASKFSDGILTAAREIVRTLSKQPMIFPTARDSIQLEYENAAGDYLEFEIFEGGRQKLFYCGSDGKTETRDNISTEMIRKAVNRFYGF